MNEIPGLVVAGSRQLEGEVALYGYKHTATLLVNASLLCNGPVRLFNLPKLTDVSVLLALARSLGCEVIEHKQDAKIFSKNIQIANLPPDITAQIHSSLYLIPVLLARFGRAPLFPIGGCQIGLRPITHVVGTLQAFGAIQSERNDGIWIEAPRGLSGTSLDLACSLPNEHSGRTKTALLAAVLASGTTFIKQPFYAQEIEDLCYFLQLCGANINWSKEEIKIQGVTNLLGAEFTLPSDFLEWATLACALLSTEGRIRLYPNPPWHYFEPEIRLFQSCGLKIHIENNISELSISNRPFPVKFQSPPIYSDLQPLLCAALCKAGGESYVTDKVWPDRIDHIIGLRSMGADIQKINGSIVVRGIPQLHGANVSGNDLRSMAALLVAACGADGQSHLSGIHHLSRGYSDLPGQLTKLGADISFDTKKLSERMLE